MIPGLRARALRCVRPVRARPRPSAPSQGANQSAGFALLAVLWTLTAVTVLTGTAITVARLGSTTTRNRILLARAAWAREACVEILQAKILPAVNLFAYGQVESPYGSGQFIKDLREAFGERENVALSEIADKEGIYASIKSFLGQGR